MHPYAAEYRVRNRVDGEAAISRDRFIKVRVLSGRKRLRLLWFDWCSWRIRSSSDPNPKKYCASQGDVDGFIPRNRERLDVSIASSRKEVAAGGVAKRTVRDIVAEGREREDGEA